MTTYREPTFVTPEPDEFLYAGLCVDAPSRVPVVRSSHIRDTALASCSAAIRTWADRQGVHRATVFRSVLLPPLPATPRADILILLHGQPAALDRIVQDDAWAALRPAFQTRARNVRKIGDTPHLPDETYLFNHFTATDPEKAVDGWEAVAPWFLDKMHVDNSLLLSPGGSDAALVNHVLLPTGPAAFLLGQLIRPSFHTFVSPRLKDHGLAAGPVLCRVATTAAGGSAN